MDLIRKMLAPANEPNAAHTDATTVSTRSAQSAHPMARRLQVGRASDVGRVRSHNEDALLTIEATFDGDEALGPFGLFVIADGMGGHQAGEVASSLAARIVASHIMRDVYAPYLLQGKPNANQMPLADALQSAVEAANQAVHSQVPGSGTTLTCAIVIDTRAYLAHVGDSRAYLYYNQQLKQVTRDHSYVDKLVELGQITAEAAAVHPQRNVLYRAVGQGDQLEIDLHMIDLPAGSRLLLCCDGLWGMLSDSAIQAVLAETKTPQDTCDRLIAAANEAGGNDNITAVIIERVN
jgi:serine/threonine protein phosphatase PrpC